MARSQLALLLLLLVSCCVPEAASTAEAASKPASKSESSKYKYWDRSAGKKKDTKLSDFNQDEDPRLKQDGLVGGDPMTPKFRWSQVRLCRRHGVLPNPPARPPRPASVVLRSAGGGWVPRFAVPGCVPSRRALGARACLVLLKLLFA